MSSLSSLSAQIGVCRAGEPGLGSRHHLHPASAEISLSGDYSEWFSRYVLAWQTSITLDTSFYLEALEQALRLGQPEIKQ
jgi:hypothetical protein